MNELDDTMSHWFQKNYAYFSTLYKFYAYGHINSNVVQYILFV